MAIVYLGLGSNLGHRKKNIETAVTALNDIGIIVLSSSSIIETDPVGGPPQEKYLNAVIKVHTTFPPIKLLERLQFIEKKMGRVRTMRNGPRIIDIDILIYGDLNLTSEKLTIPHPRMQEREFVMKPLKEIDPKIQLKPSTSAKNENY